MTWYKIIFKFIKETFIRLLKLCTTEGFGESLDFNLRGDKRCASLNNQLCQTRPTLVNVSSNSPHYNPFTVSANKCSGGCNTVDDPYARVCIPKS